MVDGSARELKQKHDIRLARDGLLSNTKFQTQVEEPLGSMLRLGTGEAVSGPAAMEAKISHAVLLTSARPSRGLARLLFVVVVARVLRPERFGSWSFFSLSWFLVLHSQRLQVCCQSGAADWLPPSLPSSDGAAAAIFRKYSGKRRLAVRLWETFLRPLVWFSKPEVPAGLDEGEFSCLGREAWATWRCYCIVRGFNGVL
jgi:hypothetical protein